MNYIYKILLLLLLPLSILAISELYAQETPCPRMDNEKLGKIIEMNASIIQGQPGFWEFNYKGRVLIVVTDEKHNRMRIITPVTETKNVKTKELSILMEANFDKALDAKYAFYKNYLWAVFTHPLGELQPEQFLNAMEQVKTLADNYGKSYTSSDLVFGGQ